MSSNQFLMEAAMAPHLSVDTEGTAIKLQKNNWEGTDYRDGTGYAFGVSLAFRDNEDTVQSKYFAFKHEEDNDSPELLERVLILVDEHPCRVMHNAQHDIAAMRTLGVHILDRFYCTRLMVHMINENERDKSLEAIAQKLLGEGKEKDAEFEWVLAMTGWHPSFPRRVMSKYAAADADRCLRVFELLLPEFIRQGFDG